MRRFQLRLLRMASMEASLTLQMKTSIAIRSSSADGRVGAMRMLLSCGSMPRGHVAPALVMVTPADFASSTVRFAVPSGPVKLMK